MKFSISCAAMSLVAIALAGCGSGSGGGTSNSPSFGPLAGTWRATALTGGGPDTPCPATFSVADGNGTLRTFGCGSDDTLIFNADGTYTGTKAPVAGAATPAAETFSGHWSQFQLRALLTVDGDNDLATFPYSTTVQFRNENQFTLPTAGLNSINRFVFTRQQ